MREILAGIGVVACLVVGCAGSATPQSEPATEPPPATENLEPEPTVAAVPTHPMELVPARAQAVAVGRSATRLLEIWGRDRLIGEVPELMQELHDGTVAVLGHDLFDPSALPALGIDPSAPLGMALLDIEHEALCFFGGTSDPEVLAITVEKLMRGTPERSTHGDTTLYVSRQDFEHWGLVIRHGMFAFVFVDRPGADRPDYISEFLELDAGASVAHGVAMERAQQGLPADADLRGMVDPAGVVRAQLGRERIRQQRRVQEAGRALAEARQQGASAQHLADLQQQLAEAQTRATAQDRERQVVTLLLSRTIGSIEGIGFFGDASDNGVIGQIHVALTPDSMIRRLLPSEGPLDPLLAAQSEIPSLTVSGQVDVGTLVDLTAQIALADGSSYAQLNAEAEEELRVDLDRRLRPLLDGRITWVQATEPIDHRYGWGVLGRLPMTVAVGVTDEESARAIIDQAVIAWPSVAWRHEPDLGGYSAIDDDEPIRWWLTVADGQIRVSNSAKMLRSTQGSPAAATTAPGWEEAWSHLTASSAAARLGLHHRYLVGALFGFRHFEPMATKEDFAITRVDDMSPEQARAIPKGRRVRALEKRLDALDRERMKLIAEDHERQYRRWWQLADQLGATIAAVRTTPTGLRLTGGHFIEGGMWRYTAAMFRLSRLGREHEPNPELARANERFFELREQIVRERQKELRRATKGR